ncbi:hypothetical protein BDV3_007220 [Batrachochytrium dendrobatidis]
MECDSKFDVIIVGTGLSECILAGALAKAGQKVLHLDTAEYYGAEYAAFNFTEFIEKQVDFSWIHQPSPTHPENDSEKSKASTNAQSAQDESAPISNSITFEQKIKTLNQLISKSPNIKLQLEKLLHLKEISTVQWDTLEPNVLDQVALLVDAFQSSRNFSLEIIPLLLYCRGPLVNLLVSSHAGPFLEFKMLEDIYLEWDGVLEKVPGSKEDVFASKTTDLVGKRYLMKFLSMVLDYKENESVWKDYQNKPFLEFLASQKLNEKMSAVIIHAIALVGNVNKSKTMTTLEGLQLTHTHLSSLGRYGKSAFLMGIYGSGSELCQAFSRYSAVYGSTYILGFELERFDIQQDMITVTGQGKTFEAKKLVAGAKYIDLIFEKSVTETTQLLRSTIISKAPIIGYDSLALAVLPPQFEVRSEGIFALQSNSTIKTCPDGFYTITLISDGVATTMKDHQEALATLTRHYNESHPDGLTALHVFHHTNHTKVKAQDGWVHDRVAVCQSPAPGIYAEHHVHEAQTLFEQLCPGGEFYPEQIVTDMGGDE